MMREAFLKSTEGGKRFCTTFVSSRIAPMDWNPAASFRFITANFMEQLFTVEPVSHAVQIKTAAEQCSKLPLDYGNIENLEKSLQVELCQIMLGAEVCVFVLLDLGANAVDGCLNHPIWSVSPTRCPSHNPFNPIGHLLHPRSWIYPHARNLHHMLSNRPLCYTQPASATAKYFQHCGAESSSRSRWSLPPIPCSAISQAKV